jgi:hypothetical protein
MTASEQQTAGIFVFPDGRMTPIATARYLGLMPKTLAIWRSNGLGPRFCKLSGRVFYFKVDIDRWVTERSDLTSSGHARAKEEMRRRDRANQPDLGRAA